MSTKERKASNVFPMKVLLEQAERGGYAVGSYSPRCTPMIAPVLRAGELVRSPLLVQISQREFEWSGLSPAEFGAAFYEQVQALRPTVPVGLHLDHTWEMQVIQEAIAAGFTSVMIDASGKELYRHQGFIAKEDILRKWEELGVNLAK